MNGLREQEIGITKDDALNFIEFFRNGGAA